MRIDQHCIMFRLGRRTYLRILKVPGQYISFQLEAGLWSLRIGRDYRQPRTRRFAWRHREPDPRWPVEEATQLELKAGLFAAVLKFREGFH